MPPAPTTISLSTEGQKTVVTVKRFESDLDRERIVKVGLQCGLSAVNPAIYESDYSDKGAVSPYKRRIAMLDIPTYVNRVRSFGMAVTFSDDLVTSCGRYLALLKGYRAGTLADIPLIMKEEPNLFPFQAEGVAWLRRNSRTLLGDDMGTGKTVQALCALPPSPSVPVLVVCPAVAKGVWEREAAVWRPKYRVTVLSGKGAFLWPKHGEIVVVNYDILPDSLPQPPVPNLRLVEGAEIVKLRERLKAGGYNLHVIADEAHYVKNPGADRTGRFRVLSGLADTVWLLTGTPLVNKPPDLYHVFESGQMALPCFGDFTAYHSMFETIELQAKQGRFKRKYTKWVRPHYPDDLARRLRRVSLKRRRYDVLKQLPEKRWKTIPVAVTERAATLKADAIFAELQVMGFDWDAARANASYFRQSPATFAAISEAAAALAAAKIPAMLATVEEFEEEEEPLVVFSAHRAPIDLLGGRPGWAAITGDTSHSKRSEHVEAFQQGHLKGIACTIQAGGVAITLTRASNALFVDRAWNPSENEQAEDRLHRIGQINPVVIMDLVAEHPFDQHVNRVLTSKKQITNATIDASARPTLEPTEQEWETLEAFWKKEMTPLLTGVPAPWDKEAR